jgi:hypothetical protein
LIEYCEDLQFACFYLSKQLTLPSRTEALDMQLNYPGGLIEFPVDITTTARVSDGCGEIGVDH